MGESEKSLASLFERARDLEPCVIFIDELESLFTSRDVVGKTGQNVKKTNKQTSL